jgi:hypothetical protein
MKFGQGTSGLDASCSSPLTLSNKSSISRCSRSNVLRLVLFLSKITADVAHVTFAHFDNARVPFQRLSVRAVQPRWVCSKSLSTGTASCHETSRLCSQSSMQPMGRAGQAFSQSPVQKAHQPTLEAYVAWKNRPTSVILRVSSSVHPISVASSIVHALHTRSNQRKCCWTIVVNRSSSAGSVERHKVIPVIKNLRTGTAQRGKGLSSAVDVVKDVVEGFEGPFGGPTHGQKCRLEEGRLPCS